MQPCFSHVRMLTRELSQEEDELDMKNGEKVELDMKNGLHVFLLIWEKYKNAMRLGKTLHVSCSVSRFTF